MSRSDRHDAAAMYLILGMRSALARIPHDPRVFAAIADGMERGGIHLTAEQRRALRVAARWMRGVSPIAGEGERTGASARVRD